VNTRFRLAIIGLGALLVVAVYTFPVWYPRLADTTVAETYPGLSPAQQSAFRKLPQEQREIIQALRQENAEQALEVVTALLSDDQEILDDMPETNRPIILAFGNFIAIDAVHQAEGTVTVYQLPDDSRFLRFEAFRMPNGPDLRVRLSKHEDPRTLEELGDDYRELSRLKGNVGKQNYTIPADVDLEAFNSVVLYSEALQTVYSTAMLR
jgi:hypothetical protein